ncbi:MAG: glycosyltransferase family 9 protein [Acidobacteria bacterium]|nr:glycosyltransferase family 9 protein [Acidobacteriota bacterium]
MSSEQLASGDNVAFCENANVFQRLSQGARVLVIRLRSMGDTILMTPALRLLHEWRPDLKLTVLCERPWNELLENNRAIESVLTLDGKFSTAWQLRQIGFSVVVNLHGGPTSALLTRATGAPWRAGFEHFRDRYAYNLSVPKAQQILGREGVVHTAEHVASCFFWLGVPRTEIPSAQVFPSPEATGSVTEKLAAMGIARGEPYAVLHPAATYATKQWSPGGFADLAEFVARDFHLRTICICGAGEAAILDQLDRSSHTPTLRAVGWNMRELIALIGGARLFAGNDSGPAHIAAAAGIPVLVVFGSSHSAVWRPWKAARSEVVQNQFDCNPCPGDRCYAYDEPKCILSVTTEQVKVALGRLLVPRSY